MDQNKDTLNKELYDSVGEEDLDNIKTLVGQGANVNAIIYGRPILHAAVQSNNAQIIKFLLDKGANVNNKDDSGNTALIFARVLGQDKVSEILEDHGGEIFF